MTRQAAQKLMQDAHRNHLDTLYGLINEAATSGSNYLDYPVKAVSWSTINQIMQDLRKNSFTVEYIEDSLYPGDGYLYVSWREDEENSYGIVV